MRLDHPGLVRAAAVRFRFDGHIVEGRVGETIAAALGAAEEVALSRRPDGTMRGLWCGIGACFECVVTVNGRASQRACLTRVEAGMEVTSSPPSIVDAVALAQGAQSEEVAVDVAVVGAGPAGLTAATLLQRRGLAVLLIDERPDLGGQYFKPVAASHSEVRGPLDRQFARSAAARCAAEAGGMAIWRNATVWSAFACGDVAVFHEERQKIVRARRLLLATGAYERATPIVGWTLPGVMTTGAAQTLARAYRVFPGSSIIIAGNGPLNFQLAVELAQAGVDVVAVVEEARAPFAMAWRAVGHAFLAAPRLMVQGASYLVELRRRSVPILWQSRVVGVAGDTRFTDAIVETPAGRRRLGANVLALNAGFVPSSELARQLGCRHAFVDRHVGYLATETDESGRTSVESIFAVGDGAHIGGAAVAQYRAVLAADAILGDLGRQELPTRAVASARRALRRALAFQGELWTLFSAPAFDVSAIADAIVVCRCENVTAGSVRATLAAHGADCGTAKRLTRIGMGRCQGRNCAAVLARLVEEAGGAKPQPAAFFAPRPPAKLVPIAALAVEQAEWGGHRQWMPPLAFPHPVRKPRHWGVRDTDVLVIGAGIVGACVARALAQQSEAVLVVDRNAIAQEASTANAGSLHVQLLSFDFGPKAQAGGRPAAETLRLGPRSIELWHEIERQSGENLELCVTGGLMVAENENDLAFLVAKASLEARYGIQTEILQATDLRKLEPALSDRLIGGAHCPAEGKINPLLATFAVVKQAVAAGAVFERDAPVQAIEREANGRFIVDTGAGRIRARRIVNCAGPWASHIAAMVGKPLPVQCAPLQVMVTEPVPPLVGRLLSHASRHLSLKQTAVGSLLIGGGWSADLDPSTGAVRPLRWAIEGNAWVARRVMPAVANYHLVRVWTGMNINIDGAPIVGEMPGVPGVFNCVTSNGYTLAPIVADIIADLMMRGHCEFDLAPFSVKRF